VNYATILTFVGTHFLIEIFEQLRFKFHIFFDFFDRLVMCKEKTIDNSLQKISKIIGTSDFHNFQNQFFYFEISKIITQNT